MCVCNVHTILYTYKIYNRMIEHNDQNNISSGAEPINLRGATACGWGRGDLWIPQQTIYALCSLLPSYYNVYIICSTYVNRGGGPYNFLLAPLLKYSSAPLNISIFREVSDLHALIAHFLRSTESLYTAISINTKYVPWPMTL